MLTKKELLYTSRLSLFYEIFLETELFIRQRFLHPSTLAEGCRMTTAPPSSAQPATRQQELLRTAGLRHGLTWVFGISSVSLTMPLLTVEKLWINVFGSRVERRKCNDDFILCFYFPFVSKRWPFSGRFSGFGRTPWLIVKQFEMNVGYLL